MPSILLTVFILQLVIHVVNTLGASTINNVLWSLYINFASPKSAADQRELKSQFMRVRKEMNSTSSQDEFAKWAKLRRQHDKLLEQLEKSKASSDAAKSAFETTASSLRWVCTNGFRMYIQYSYMKQPMFWVPRGWVPYYAEWLLSFPRAPLGSVSVNVWVLACTAVIKLAHEALVAVVALVGKSGFTQKKGAPIRVGGEKTQTAEGAKSKKES